MKISFIATILNEEKHIEQFIDSLLNQSKLPDEIIIVDGGSSDKTVESIKYKVLSIKPEIKFKLLIKQGNRSVGRNEAIRQATGDVIVCSDAGCVLDKNWVEKIIEPFKDKKINVVAGYYKGRPRSIFEKCFVPYVLVMPDRVNSDNFLPATRSMAFKKLVWKKVGGFPEEFSYNEDYVFANRLKDVGAKIVFQKDAIVYWIPRKTIREAFIMFFRFALGDVQAKILRPKVILLFFRYMIGIFLIIWFLIFKSYFILHTLYFILGLYIVWSIAKNYKYVKNYLALFVLPVIQLTSDTAILTGTILGFVKSLKR